MSKTLVDGHEQFDGYPVTVYNARFSGTIDLPDESGASLEYDDVIVMVVTATVGKSTIDATRSGDLRRTNVMKVTDAVVVPYSQVNDVRDLLSDHPQVETTTESVVAEVADVQSVEDDSTVRVMSFQADDIDVPQVDTPRAERDPLDSPYKSSKDPVLAGFLSEGM